MSVQNSYKFDTTIGEAGGIIDIAPYEIDSFTNEEATGKLVYGVGVVVGTAAGKQVKLPVTASTANKFEGIVVNRRTNEYDMDGKLHIFKDSTVGVMRYGRIYGRVVKTATIAYGDAVYMVKSGDDAGKFTNVADGNLAVKARFLGAADTVNEIAPIELFNGAAPSAN